MKNNTTFTASGGAPFSSVVLSHGGQVRIDAAVQWSSNTGAPYSGAFTVQPQMVDSAFVPVGEMTGPAWDVVEMFSTAVGDTFTSVGTTTFNARDSFFTPPYNASLEIQNSQSVGLSAWSMFVAIENPTGLT